MSNTRVITAAAELDALPFESVVTDAYDTPYICVRCRVDGSNEWRMTGQDYAVYSEDILLHGDAVVRWEPNQ